MEGCWARTKSGPAVCGNSSPLAPCAPSRTASAWRRCRSWTVRTTLRGEPRKNNTSASAITQRPLLCRHGRLQISTHTYTHQPGYITQAFVYEDKGVQESGVIIRNTRKSSRNNTSLILGMFLLGRRHFDVTFHAGSTTEFPFGSLPLPDFLLSRFCVCFKPKHFVFSLYYNLP